MTKLVLSIEGDASTLAKVLTALGASAAISATVAPTPTLMTPGPVSTDDDDSTDTPAAAGTLDKDGLPHDTRIHSDPAKLTGKGVWRKRRGVSDAEVATVEAQLRAAQQPGPAPVQQSVSVAPPMPVQASPQPQEPFQVPASISGVPGGVVLQVPQQTPPVHQPAPMPVQQPQPAPVQTGTATPIPSDFGAFMQGLTAAMNKRNPDGSAPVDVNYLAALTQRISQAFNTSLNAITDIQNNPQMIGYAAQLMQADGHWN